MREFLSRHEIGKDDGFRWRAGNEISRMEGFSDAVFGFAVTLLVVSLEVPKTFDELMQNMGGFAGFAAAFAVLFIIWMQQYKFFRRYGLQDGPTLWLNALLLFLVLFFVYPLKFLFSWLFQGWAGGNGLVHLPDGRQLPMMKPGQERLLMLIYGAGYIAVFSVFLLLYLRAYTQRRQLELSPLEVFDTTGSMWETGWQAIIGALSFTLAWFDRPGLAGVAYCLIGPVLTANGFWRGRVRRRILASQPARPAG